jgi:thiamine-monophosphate kinase
MDEFRLIDELLQHAGAGVSGVRVGPGDDAAVVRAPRRKDLVVTSDAQVEGVHFEWNWLEALDVGYRAGAACLSDIAAMGATPWVVLSSLAIPPSLSLEAIRSVQRGLDRVLRRHRAALVGGNVTRSPNEFSITLTALGTVAGGREVQRRGARAGDRIWVSGRPGRAVLGWHEVRGGRSRSAYARAFRRPIPRIELGAALGRAHLASSMIDLSDGLAGDLAHLLGSRHGALLDWRRLNPGPAFVGECRRLGLDPVHLVLHGGEDYELLFTVSAEVRESRLMGMGERLGLRLRNVGVVEPEPGICLLDGSGDSVPVEPVGFRHPVGSE